MADVRLVTVLLARLRTAGGFVDVGGGQEMVDRRILHATLQKFCAEVCDDMAMRLVRV
jgi:hypothetical protein